MRKYLLQHKKYAKIFYDINERQSNILFLANSLASGLGANCAVFKDGVLIGCDVDEEKLDDWEFVSEGVYLPKEEKFKELLSEVPNTDSPEKYAEMFKMKGCKVYPIVNDHKMYIIVDGKCKKPYKSKFVGHVENQNECN